MTRRFGSTGRLSQAVVHRGVVTTSGQVADRPEGAGVAEQMRQALSQVDRLLAEAGSDKGRLLTAQVWLTDMADFAAMNVVWDNWIDPGALPTRTTTQTPMTRPEWRVAVAVTAEVFEP